MGLDKKYSTAVIEILGELKAPASLHYIVKLLHRNYSRIGLIRIDSRNTKDILSMLIEENKVEMIKKKGHHLPLYILKGNCNVRR